MSYFRVFTFPTLALLIAGLSPVVAAQTLELLLSKPAEVSAAKKAEQPVSPEEADAASPSSVAGDSAISDSTDGTVDGSTDRSADNSVDRAADSSADSSARDSEENAPLDTVPATPRAENIDLKEVTQLPNTTTVFPEETDALADEPEPGDSEAVADSQAMLSAENLNHKPNNVRNLLGVDVPASTTTRIDWTPSRSFAGMAVDTPVLVVNGAWDGPTLCLTAAIHGDELNGIEMVRRVLYDLDPKKLHGMVVGVPIVNLLGFSRNSRYLPDRRDLNRYFPGNAKGSVAARLAHAFFNDVIKHCNALVDLHTGSFYRTNISQLRADMSKPNVAEFAELFGDIPVLNTGGNGSSLRAAAVRAGIPAVTLEAGEPMRMQVEVVEEGVKAINTLLEKNGMYPSFSLWAKPSPAFYRSAWMRANSSGILFSTVKLGGQVEKGDVLGQVINPISNEKKNIVSMYKGRVLGMALDQFVLPGFAAYHIGIREARVKNVKVIAAATEETVDDDDTLESESKPAGLETPKPMTPEEEGFDDE